MRQIKVDSVTGTSPISLSDAKSYIRIDTDEDDDLITRMIAAAISYCENHLSRDIISKTRSYFISQAAERFSLPYAPIDSVQSVKSNNSNITYETIGLNDLEIKLNQSYTDNVLTAYTTLGMADEAIKLAILQLTSTYYDNRADFVEGNTVVGIPTNVRTILNGHKTMFI